jgi:hypothetical protein
MIITKNKTAEIPCGESLPNDAGHHDGSHPEGLIAVTTAKYAEAVIK